MPSGDRVRSAVETTDVSEGNGQVTVRTGPPRPHPIAVDADHHADISPHEQLVEHTVLEVLDPSPGDQRIIVSWHGRRYFVTTGFTGALQPPVKGSGAAQKQNS